MTSQQPVISSPSRGRTASAANEVVPVREPQQVNTGKELSQQFFIQRKLSIGAVDDPLEKEADAMADKVMRMSIPEPISFSHGSAGINRKCAHCEEEEQLQRKESSGESTSTAPPVVHEVLSSSGGKSLDEGTRSFMEQRFNTDFGNVKIHDSDIAAKSASSINALAYTSGNNVVFNSGQYNTNSDSGKRLLAHELTHVVQQGGASNLVQRAVTDTKQETYAGLFELKQHNPLGGPTFAPQAQYDVRIEFAPYMAADCDQIAMTQTLVSRLKGGLVSPSAAQTARQLAAADGTEGVAIDRLSGRTSPIYGMDNVGTAAGNAHFGNRKGNGIGDKAWMTDKPGFTGAAAASSRTAGDAFSQHLQTCAICNAGKDRGVYYGCVNWGFDIDAANKFTEDSFALVSRGTPSADFLAAAKKWNDQTVPVATDDLPLPTHKTKQTSMTEAQLKAEIATLETTLKALPAGHVNIPQITFELRVYKDILDGMLYNKLRGYTPLDIKAIQAVVGSTINGDFDFDTILKIKRWQVEQSLKGDGYFGPASKAKFDAIVTAAVATNKAKGFTIDQIKKIQVEVGSNDDGSWGPLTVKSLMVWQKDHRLLATGEFDIFTRVLMFGLFGF